MKELAFAPTSMAVDYGYLAVGGQRSQLVVSSLSSEWSAHTNVGGSINNALAISNLTEPRILVCNNDESIKIVSLPTLEKTGSISLPTAANYVAVSPDQQKMVAVGDSNQAFLYDIRQNYAKIASLQTVNDAGFACSWNPASQHFAISCQDGHVCVFDTRNTSCKLAILNSQQNPQIKGACRNVKFSQTNSLDLLMYSEHVNYVTVVDTRDYSTQQAIRVTPPNTDLHISGISFDSECSSVFVGLEASLIEYKIDLKTRRIFPIGSIL